MVWPLVGALVGAMGAAGAGYFGAKGAKKAGRQGEQAAAEAYDRYRREVERGLTESGGYYDEAQGFLRPYADMGQRSAGLLEDIIGLNGPEKQQAALAMYKGSPSSALLGDVKNEAIRRTLGTASATGQTHSGSTAESLGRRLSDIELQNYYNWEGLPKGLLSTGMQASGIMSGNAMNRGGQVLGARSSIGSAGANSSIMAGNARMGATMGEANAWGGALGGATKAFGSFLGGLGGTGSSAAWRSPDTGMPYNPRTGQYNRGFL